MAKKSAGLLVFRERAGSLEVLLVHPGGPFWRNKDAASWSIPKGEFGDDEQPLDAARREFEEETSLRVDGPFLPMLPLRQRSGKLVHAWAVRQDLDLAGFKSNTFSLEWPTGSGNVREYPEADRAAWFDLEAAREKILPGQAGFLDQLVERVKAGG
ncbi:MAG: NUDIX domain-containing protein [Candidatus Eisenbacteria bacterium]|nr:NUDIX domain-containing protein [Candidatus Eisenbacteria bacterium]